MKPTYNDNEGEANYSCAICFKRPAAIDAIVFLEEPEEPYKTVLVALCGDCTLKRSEAANSELREHCRKVAARVPQVLRPEPDKMQAIDGELIQRICGN